MRSYSTEINNVLKKNIRARAAFKYLDYVNQLLQTVTAHSAISEN